MFYSHASHSQNWDQQRPSLYRHVQPPDEEKGKNSKSKVADNGDGAVQEGEANDDIHVDAIAALDCSVPEESDGCALEESDEEEYESGENGKAHGDEDDPFV